MPGSVPVTRPLGIAADFRKNCADAGAAERKPAATASTETKRGTGITPSFCWSHAWLGLFDSVPKPFFRRLRSGPGPNEKGRPVARAALSNTLTRDDYIAFAVFSVTVVFASAPMLSIGAAASMFVTIVSVVVTFSVGTTSVVLVTLVEDSLLVHAEARRAAPAIIEPATILERTARM
jgi:hypothetical protein